MAELIYDNFKIVNKYHLNGEDYNNLSKLYLPIMGIDSFSLYNVLLSLEIDKEYTYKVVLDLLNGFSLASLNQAMDKLEALYLVKTYHNKRLGYIHKLYPPLSKRDFLNNELLCACLASQIGASEIEALKNDEAKIEGFSDVSKKFEDVFSMDTKSKESFINSLFINDVNVDNKSFNYVLFKAMFDGTIPEDVLEDNEFKRHILRVAFTYKLNVDEMHEVVVKTMTIDKNLEYASISKNAKMAFQNKYNAKEPILKANNEDKYVGSLIDEEWQEIINLVDNMSFSDVLQSLSGIKPSVAEVAMFEKLQNNTNFPVGVINLLILQVNKEKNGDLPGYNYFEKIANTWARAKIKTSYDVIKYYQAKNSVDKEVASVASKKANMKKPVLPSWYSDYKNDLDKEKPMTEEQTKQMIDLVKDMFGNE